MHDFEHGEGLGPFRPPSEAVVVVRSPEVVHEAGRGGAGEEEGEGEDEEMAPEKGGEDVVGEEVELEGGEAAGGGVGEGRGGLLGVAVETFPLEGLAAGRSDVGHGGAATGERRTGRTGDTHSADGHGTSMDGNAERASFVLRGQDRKPPLGQNYDTQSATLKAHPKHTQSTFKAQQTTSECIIYI